jgi:hypothetical protein
LGGGGLTGAAGSTDAAGQAGGRAADAGDTSLMTGAMMPEGDYIDKSGVPDRARQLVGI